MSGQQTIKLALERAAKTVTLKPERGQRVYRNVAVVGEGTSAHVEEAGRELIADVGRALGGTDAGPTPSMILRSAMSSCVAIGVKQWAACEDVPIDRVEVTVETDVDARGQLAVCDDAVPGFEEIRLTIVVTSTASRAAIEEVVAKSLKYSPLIDVFSRSQRLQHRVLLAGASGLSGE